MNKNILRGVKPVAAGVTVHTNFTEKDAVSRIFNFKYINIVILSLFLLLTFFSGSGWARWHREAPRKDISLKVSGNNITAFINEREIVSWYPRIKYSTVEKELWHITFPSLKDKGRIYGPTQEINGKIYFAYSSFVMELDMTKAQITNRYQVLGEITGLTSEGNKLIINTFNGVRGQVWDKEQVVRVNVEQLKNIAKFATITNRDYENIYVKRRDAEQLSNIIEKIYIPSLIENKYDADILEQVRQEYLDAVAADTTNPWYYIYLGLISEDLGRKVYSNVYYQKALEIKSLVFYDYFQLSTFYEYIGERTMADRAFDEGMKDYIGRGYTPEQLTSTKSFLNYTNWLIPAIEKLKDKDVDRTIILMDRYYQLAPLKEGNFNILRGVEKYLIDKGKLPESRIWQVRAGRTQGFFFPGDYSIILADFGLNIFLACMISFLLFSVIFLSRDLSQFIEDVKHHKMKYREFFFRRYLSKRNIYSFVILYGFSLVMLGVCSNTLGLIGKMVKEPATINAGTWGNYASVKYFDKDLPDSPDKNLFLAIANHQLKDYATAIKLYETQDNPVVHNNLAAIYLKQGKKAKAREELQTALKQNKYMLEARYNMTLVDSKAKVPQKEEKVELYKKYGPSIPIIAMPGESQFKKVFYSGFDGQDFNPVNIRLFNKFLKGSDSTVLQFSWLITPVFIIFTLVLIALLLSVFVPQTFVNTLNHTYSRRFAGLIFPGVSYNWKLFGPVVFALWLGLGITNLFYYGFSFETLNPSPAIGLLTSFALPDYSVLSPMPSYELPYSSEIGFISAIFFVMIWIFNFFYVLISRRYVVT
jgi:tetratricopeptide (TPR) repeat protein